MVLRRVSRRVFPLYSRTEGVYQGHKDVTIRKRRFDMVAMIYDLTDMQFEVIVVISRKKNINTPLCAKCLACF